MCMHFKPREPRLAGTPKTATASATGTGASAQIKDGGGNVVVFGLSVGAGDCDINFNSIAFSAGQAITLNSATLTHP